METDDPLEKSVGVLSAITEQMEEADPSADTSPVGRGLIDAGAKGQCMNSAAGDLLMVEPSDHVDPQTPICYICGYTICGTHAIYLNQQGISFPMTAGIPLILILLQ